MTRPEFVVQLADLENDPKVVDRAISEDFLRHVLEGSDATPLGEGHLQLELSKSGRDVLVRGHATMKVTVPCVVTLDPLPFDLRAEILLLLSPAPESPGRRGHGKPPGPHQAKASKPGAPKKGKRSKPWSDEPELSENEAATDTFSGDEVVLDTFLREFLLLELPMYPRRSDLPSPGDAAIGPAPQPEGPAPIDPRLSPLAELAKRLVSNEQKKE